MPKGTYSVTDFPYEIINKTMHLALEHSEVRVHKLIWKKLARKHPESLSIAESYLDQTLQHPDYVGQGPLHFYNIELVKRTPVGTLLVAVKIRDARGFYCRPIIASTYVINHATVHNRVTNGTLKRLLSKKAGTEKGAEAPL